MWLWTFAERYHCPPPVWDDLTVEDTDRGIRRLAARAQLEATETI